MSLDPRLDVPARGWRGRLFAALVALIAGLPGLIALPALDRDETRFAQSTAQMLETGDFIDVRYQDQARAREPVVLHQLQALSVSVLSSPEARQIWAYRIPSLLAALLAAAACAWGAEVFFAPAVGALAGAILGGGLILSTEAGIGRSDALLCGAITLAMAALARIYAAAREDGAQAGLTTRLLLWLGLAVTGLDAGLGGLAIVGLAGLALWASERRAPWLRNLGWTWGLILFAALVGPWLAAVTVRTDGQAWTSELASGLGGVGPGGRPPFGLHSLAAPLLLFPFAALLPAALVAAWKARREPGPRFAVCWLVPNWLVFELSPGRQIHDVLPLYGALAWLAAFALTRPLGRASRWIGAALSVVAAVVIAGVASFLARRIGGDGATGAAGLAGVLALAAGVAGAIMLFARRPLPALAATAILGVAAHGAIVAGLAPRLTPLWLARNVADGMDRMGLNPRGGLAPGPVTVVGFAEPSIVFALGTETELGDVGDAVEAISEGRPVVVEQAAAPAFERALAAAALKATQVSVVAGLDYVDGRAALLHIYRSDSPPPADAVDHTDRPAPTPEPPAARPREHKPMGKTATGRKKP
jgi:4-amino-4-deoxy-L-arabinose transferase-like glycosyltransferase